MAATIEELQLLISQKDAIILAKNEEILKLESQKKDLESILESYNVDIAKLTFVGKNGLNFADAGKSVQIGEIWYKIAMVNFRSSKLEDGKVLVLNENLQADLFSKILQIKGQTALIEK